MLISSNWLDLSIHKIITTRTSIEHLNIWTFLKYVIFEKKRKTIEIDNSRICPCWPYDVRKTLNMISETIKTCLISDFVFGLNDFIFFYFFEVGSYVKYGSYAISIVLKIPIRIWRYMCFLIEFWTFKYPQTHTCFKWVIVFIW